MSTESLSDWVENVGQKHGFSSSSEPEVCEPTRPSEVVSGAASSQYSTGEVTDETAAEGQQMTQGARENAESDDFSQAGSGYTDGSNPMQSPNLGSGNFTKRYGVGFLCAVYTAPGFGNLSEVAGYASPTSTYRQAFQGMDKSKQYLNPASSVILAQIQAWTTSLANALEGCGQGELVVSFQGHGQGGNIFGVDGTRIASSQLMGLARTAEGQGVSITYVLDACETGGAVPEFQDHAADRVDQNVDETEGAGQVCSEENEAMAEALRDRMAHARELIQLSQAIGAHGTAMIQAATAVQRAANDQAAVNAWNQVTALNTQILREVQAMQNQFHTNMDFGSDSEMRLDVIERAFTTLLAALNQVAPQSGFDLRNDWCAKVGEFQDTVSDGANRIIQICNQRAREYSAAG